MNHLQLVASLQKVVQAWNPAGFYLVRPLPHCFIHNLGLLHVFFFVLSPMLMVCPPQAPWLQGDNPYEVAAARGNKRLLRLLIRFGARPKDADSDWKVCVQSGHATECLCASVSVCVWACVPCQHTDLGCPSQTCSRQLQYLDCCRSPAASSIVCHCM